MLMYVVGALCGPLHNACAAPRRAAHRSTGL